MIKVYFDYMALYAYRIYAKDNLLIIYTEEDIEEIEPFIRDYVTIRIDEPNVDIVFTFKIRLNNLDFNNNTIIIEYKDEV